jgi:hypothetical protein
MIELSIGLTHSIVKGNVKKMLLDLEAKILGLALDIFKVNFMLIYNYN